mgnify:FL=1
MRRLRGEIHGTLTWGDLALRLKGRRADEGGARSQQRSDVAASAPAGMATRLLEAGRGSEQ